MKDEFLRAVAVGFAIGLLAAALDRRGPHLSWRWWAMVFVMNVLWAMR